MKTKYVILSYVLVVFCPPALASPTTNINLYFFNKYEHNLFRESQENYSNEVGLNDIKYPSTKFSFDIEPFIESFYSFSVSGQIEFLNAVGSYHKDNSYLSILVGASNRLYLPLFYNTKAVLKNEIAIGTFKSGSTGLMSRYSPSLSLKFSISEWFSLNGGFEFSFDVLKTTYFDKKRTFLNIDGDLSNSYFFNKSRAFFVGLSSTLF
jgi:hypothetical protein